MKILMYLMLFITATNCGSSQQTGPETTKTAPEPVEEQTDLLIGEIERDDLQEEFWFDPMYKSYKPNKDALQVIRENINDYEIKMYMGTWCADSQREVPKFYKLLDLSSYNMDDLEVIAVREDKTLPDDSQQQDDVKYVPTIIFSKNGKEVGRFVEYPQEEFEDDIAKIVSGQEYEHSYQN
ncbi:thioredoxin family protein [Salinimicrobium sp. CDJ15-81-2]|nr:thioredoxin family protein [Salinimicrobium nanhaiense]